MCIYIIKQCNIFLSHKCFTSIQKSSFKITHSLILLKLKCLMMVESFKKKIGYSCEEKREARKKF